MAPTTGMKSKYLRNQNENGIMVIIYESASRLADILNSGSVNKTSGNKFLLMHKIVNFIKENWL